MRHPRSFLAALIPLPALLAGLAAPPAEAAVFTSTGVRCTIVGTSGSEVLVGTRNRDVICGRGGHDVIRARGGDDVVDAGGGADEVVAGPGDDRVSGAQGTDVVDGGDGNDRLSGGGGADELNGAAGIDGIVGGDGADRIEGGTSADVLAGQGGNDQLSGSSGADQVSGGSGADELEGGDNADDLDGQVGDDFLDGGGGADDLDGGEGTNMCAVDAADESQRCRYDELPPVMVETQISPSYVDVTDRSALVSVKVHVTDDTGVEDVQVSLHSADYSIHVDVPPALMYAGDARDGWWQTTFEVSRYTRPGELLPTVSIRDRLDRQTFDSNSPARLNVADANPDLQMPTMTLLDPLTTEPVDVRTGDADVTVSVRATDALSGVARVDLCLTRFNPDYSPPMYTDVVCREGVPMASGTIHDGVYTAVLRIPQGSPGGDYNVKAYTVDFAETGPGVCFMGPDAYPRYVESGSAGPEARPFPGDAGRLSVLGTDNTTRPRTDSVTLAPTQVDTLTTDATAHIALHALDAATEGVTGVTAVLVPADNVVGAPQFSRVDLTRTLGTPADGTWEGDLTLPQSTPPGRYDVLVFVSDVSLSSNYTGTGSPYADSPGYHTLVDDPHIDVVEQPH